MLRPSVFLSCTLLLISCETLGPAETAPPSFLRAEITGALELAYEGTGDFWRGGSRELGRSLTFGINSRGHGPAERQSFSLWRQGEGRPARGTYTLSAPDSREEMWKDFAAVYRRTGDEVMEAFVAQSGTVHITVSTPEHIEGTFQFSGLRYCARSVSGTPWMEGSCRPSKVDPEAPALQVAGSFVAVPSKDTAAPLIGH